MPLLKGHRYTWAQILQALGADDTAPPFALHQGIRVVGFALNRWHNPSAPREILVGYGSERETMADSFITERPIVPILIKEGKNEASWCCAGNYQLLDWTDSAAEKNKRVNRVDVPAIYKILLFEEVQQ